MKVENTSLQNVKLITPPTIFEDFRGSYVETYNRDLYHQAGITTDFIQDDISISTRHVLRGIHGDEKTCKLVSCLYGSFYIVVLDMELDSSTYKKWEGFTLSDTNRLQLLIPPRHGNGHVVLKRCRYFSITNKTQFMIAPVSSRYAGTIRSIKFGGQFDPPSSLVAMMKPRFSGKKTELS